MNEFFPGNFTSDSYQVIISSIIGTKICEEKANPQTMKCTKSPSNQVPHQISDAYEFIAS